MCRPPVLEGPPFRDLKLELLGNQISLYGRSILIVEVNPAINSLVHSLLAWCFIIPCWHLMLLCLLCSPYYYVVHSEECSLLWEKSSTLTVHFIWSTLFGNLPSGWLDFLIMLWLYLRQMNRQRNETLQSNATAAQPYFKSTISLLEMFWKHGPYKE